MRRKFQHAILILATTLLTVQATTAAEIKLTSPDGRLVLNFDVKTIGASPGCPVYQVNFQGRPVLGDSRLGLHLADGSLDSDLEIVGQQASTTDTTWRPVLGEREIVRDHFNQLVLDLQTTRPPHRRLQLTFRAYDEGVAFCYRLPAQTGLTNFVIRREATQFAFTADHTAWAVYSAQGNYDPNDPRRRSKSAKTGPVALSELEPGVERPLTVRVADDLYSAITEARLVDYARMKLRPATNADHTLEVFLDAERGMNGEVTGIAPFASPWRVVMVATSPGQLLEHNDLVLNLNDPCALADTSWIKPGKVIREATLTTAGGKACVDFAVQQGLQFIEYDAGWYGYESDAKSDARAVHLDPRRNPDPTSLNLPEVIDYANARNIGVILYVNQKALSKQLDEILPLYENWGVKGVKYGFVNVGSQQATAWLHAAIRQAAAHHLMVDIHDEFRNTGYQRTYPNLMTCEGIGGNEEFPTPVHNATLPFTRFLTGPADYTFCWYDRRLQNTHAHQLALSTIFFSPWQFIYWYDKPAAFDGDPALDYWKHLPTTWDESRVLQGDIGRRAVVARRKGSEWFLGAIAPVDGELPIPLKFLAPGKKFTAKIYSDSTAGLAGGDKVQISEQTVDTHSVLEAHIPANGGLAARFVPVN
jgi:alpha-glucosidase